MEEANYEKYKKAFRLQGIMSLSAYACALLMMIFFVFLPNFQIRLVDELFGTEIKLFELNFSIFDDMKSVLGSFGGMSKESQYMAINIVSGVYQLFAAVLFAVALVLLCSGIGQSIFCLANLDGYAMSAYDKIRYRQDIKSKNKRGFTLMGYVFSSVVFELFYIVFGRYLLYIFGNITETRPEEIVNLLIYCTGVSGAISVFILFAVATVALYLVFLWLKSKTKSAILKENYQVSTTNTNDPFDL